MAPDSAEHSGPRLHYAGECLVILLALEHDGVLIGSVKDTTAQALDELCSLFGEQIAERYAAAAASLAGDSPRTGGAPVLTPVVESDSDSVPGAPTEVPSQGGEGAVPAGEDAGAGTAAPPAGASPEAAQQATCGICGTDGVASDWATVSVELYGEVRCISCSDK